jgi:hypothetical protein
MLPAAPPPPWGPPPPSAWSGYGVWQDGEFLVVAHGAKLPTHMCVKCGGVAGGSPEHKTLRWHEPLIGLIVLVSPIIYVIVALIVTKSFKVAFGLCTACRARHNTKLYVGFGLLAGTVLCVALDIAVVKVGLVALLGILLFLGSLIPFMLARLLVPARIDARYAKIRGASPAFRALFPPAVPPPPPWPPMVPGPGAPAHPDPNQQKHDEELRRLR